MRKKYLKWYCFKKYAKVYLDSKWDLNIIDI